jgi:hypothetical protein
MMVQGVLLSTRYPQWIGVPVTTDIGLSDFRTVDDLATDWWVTDGRRTRTIVNLASCRRLVSLGHESGEKLYIFFSSQAAGFHGHNECVLKLSQGNVRVRGDVLLVKIGKDGSPVPITEQSVAAILRTAVRSVALYQRGCIPLIVCQCDRLGLP